MIDVPRTVSLAVLIAGFGVVPAVLLVRAVLAPRLDRWRRTSPRVAALRAKVRPVTRRPCSRARPWS